MTEKEYLASVSTFAPFGPARIKLLLSYFGAAKKIWNADPKKLAKLGLGVERTRNFIEYRANFNAQTYFKKLERLGIGYFTQGDASYPQNLKEIDDCPFVLYYKGSLKTSDINSIAVVGSRKMTSYGAEVTQRFASELSSFGITIISGLARGVDTIAHKAAIEAQGRTLAVVGCGLDSIYPPENSHLAVQVVRHGALVSEYPLGYPALPVNFPARNRIISGLSKGVLVVEGAEKSGTLLTASHAANQGRAVFAVPGQITSPLSKAPLFLIKNGAKMVTDPRDILEELGIEARLDREKMERVMPSGKGEASLLSILDNEPLHLDEIARASSLGVSDVSARLTIMELKGLVKNMGGGIYKKI